MKKKYSNIRVSLQGTLKNATPTTKSFNSKLHYHQL
jgi:hypothetical protein